MRECAGSVGAAAGVPREVRRMRVRLTVIDPAGPGVPVDVLVTAPAGTAFGEVRPQLLGTAGCDPVAATPLYVGESAIPDDAPVGRAPLLEGAVLTVGSPGIGPGRRGMLELHVIGGPGAGAAHRLLPGEHALGRAAEAAIRVPALTVSRFHAALLVAPDIVAVRDLGSTNGTAIE